MSNKLKLYQENFQTIISAYAAGIRSYPGEVYDELIYIFLKDLEPMFVEALKYEYAFDILDIAEKFCEAGMFRLSPEGVVDTLLSLFPHPSALNVVEQDTLIKILELVDRTLPGTIERIQYEWRQAA